MFAHCSDRLPLCSFRLQQLLSMPNASFKFFQRGYLSQRNDPGFPVLLTKAERNPLSTIFLFGKQEHVLAKDQK